MVDAFLEGYNGTIFAYGQTSSGKLMSRKQITILLLYPEHT